MIRLIATRANKFFFKVYFDEELLGGVPSSALRKLGLTAAEGTIDCADSSAVVDLVREWVLENARNRLLGYLAKAERTCYDCRMFLRKSFVPEAVIDAVIAEAEEQQWVSDERYAGLYAEDAFMNRMSPLDAKYKLRLKKIDPLLINKAVKKTYDVEGLGGMIEDLIDVLIERNVGLTGQKLYQKVATALYRKGFEYEAYEEMLKRKVF